MDASRSGMNRGARRKEKSLGGDGVGRVLIFLHEENPVHGRGISFLHGEWWGPDLTKG